MLKVVISALALLASASIVVARTPVQLTPDGLGPLRIGMPERELVRRFHFVAPKDDPTDASSCTQLESDQWPGVSVMTEKHRVTRISLFRDSKVADERGLRVGMSEADVRHAYHGVLKNEPHAYDNPPAGYFTYRRPDGRGIRYELNAHRRVTAIYAGGSAIEYIEGCD